MNPLKTMYIAAIILMLIAIAVILIFEFAKTEKPEQPKSPKTIIITSEQSQDILAAQHQTAKQSPIPQPQDNFLFGINPGFFINSGGASQTAQQNQETDEESIEIQCLDNFLFTPENFKVAFIGDTGYGENFRRVLELIIRENTDLVLHQGDLGYDENNPESDQLWLNIIEDNLDPVTQNGIFPYFYSIGNHETPRWEEQNGYRDILKERLEAFNINYIGTEEQLGSKTAFYYNNLFITLTAPGIREEFTGNNHWLFLDQELRNSNALWKICSWHKNQGDMQAGDKHDETGWEVYETCREHGALIMTGHSHTYSRTHVLSDMSEQIIADNTNPYTINKDQTFAVVSGLGGRSIRSQENFDTEHFASIYTRTQNADYGALFIEFNIDNNPRKARGYFKNIDGEIIDEFELINEEVYECQIEEIDIFEDFVYTEGNRLMLNEEPYRFIGVNVYGLANSEIYNCGPSAGSGRNPEEYLSYLFPFLKEKRVDVIRFWAFPQFTDSGNDFSAIDRVIRYAEENDIKLIPVFENQWDHCPGSMHKWNEWYRRGYLSPYTGNEISYKDYVEQFVENYKDEPAILMWQLMNEAQSETPESEADSQSLLNFAEDMSNFVRSIDQNHIISLGTIGRGQSGIDNENFIYLHNLPNIDIIEVHDYNSEEEPIPSSNYHSVRRAFNIAEDLNKPFFIGEAGIKQEEYSIEERAGLFEEKISASFDAGFDGYLIWEYDNFHENYGRENCRGHCFTENDPLLEVIEGNS